MIHIFMDRPIWIKSHHLPNIFFFGACLQPMLGYLRLIFPFHFHDLSCTAHSFELCGVYLFMPVGDFALHKLCMVKHAMVYFPKVN